MKKHSESPPEDTIMLECPICLKKGKVERDFTDPEEAVLFQVMCGQCSGGICGPAWFVNSKGRKILEINACMKPEVF